MRSCVSVVVLMSGLVAGCGGKPPSGLTFVPVAGVVTLDGQPLAEADITAVPSGTTPGLGGTARSAEKGAFTLSHARGERGLPAGEYRLTVSLRKLPDGTVPPVNDPTPPIESHARETLPPHYSNPDQTILTWSVTSEPRPLELKLDSQASPASR